MSTEAPQRMLQVKGVSKHFGGLHAVERASFDVPEGLITSMIGPNGAGKTTLFNVISGLLPMTEGRIAFKGTDITGWSAHRIVGAGMGRTFQSIEYFANLNTVENVIAARFCRTRSSFLESLLSMPRDWKERRSNREMAEELLDWVGLSDRRYFMPNELSYGMQRRLEVARALATEPDMLMMDEPTAGLTQTIVEGLMELIIRLKDMGKTIFLIEHNMNVVMSISDKVVVMNFGEMLAEGTPAEVQANPDVVDAYLGVRA
jgi:branched-chain amino acid transport system ATP-binding protein